MKRAIRIDTDQLAASRPLVVAVNPLPGESLASLVARSTRRNVLRYPRVILSEVGLSMEQTGTIAIEIAGLEERLAEKIGCSTADVLARAMPKVPISSAGDIQFGGSTMVGFDLDLKRRWISPATLSQADAHLVAWSCRLLPFCPISLERLISKCPRCMEVLGWREAWGIGICEHCRQKVEHPDGEVLEPHLVEGYRTFAKLISSDQAERAEAMAALSPEVQAFSLAHLARLIVGLGRNCRAEPFPRYHPGLPAKTVADVVALGTDMLHDWPNRLRDRIVAEIGAIGWDHEQPVRPMLQGLRKLGSYSVPRPEQINLVRTAIPEVFEPKPRALGGLRASVMILKDIRSHINLSTTQMKPVNDARALQFSMRSDSPRSRLQYDRESTMDFINRLKASEPASAAEGTLGIPRYGVEQLVCLGEISREDHPAIEIIYPGLRLVSPLAYLADIKAAARSDAVPCDAISLRRAIRCIGGRCKPWGVVLKAMRSGELDFWLPDDEVRGDRTERFVARALVCPTNLSAFIRQVFKEADFPDFHHFSPGMCQIDAGDLLNIDPGHMIEVIAAGGLEFEAQARGSRCPKERVLELARTMITPTEICVRWGLHPSKVNRAMRSNDRIARFLVGWLRTDVEREMALLEGDEACR